MTEITQVWQRVREELGPYGHLTRIEFPVVPGTPDVCYTIRGITGWLELKKLKAPNKCHNLRASQVEFAEAVDRAGGLWHLLGRHNTTWFLYDLHRARGLLKGGVSLPLMSISGPLPVAELLKFLAPR